MNLKLHNETCLNAEKVAKGLKRLEVKGGLSREKAREKKSSERPAGREGQTKRLVAVSHFIRRRETGRKKIIRKNLQNIEEG